MLRIVGILAAAACVASVAAPGATGPRTATVRGIEVAATSTKGTFAGTGTAAGARVVWQAVVKHERLRHVPVAITGGSFRLATFSGGTQVGLSTGRFSGGTIARLSQAAGCGRQVYSVDGALASSTGTGKVEIRLTHFRRKIFGRCIAYAASVSGTFSLAD